MRSPEEGVRGDILWSGLGERKVGEGVCRAEGGDGEGGLDVVREGERRGVEWRRGVEGGLRGGDGECTLEWGKGRIQWVREVGQFRRARAGGL